MKRTTRVIGVVALALLLALTGGPCALEAFGEQIASAKYTVDPPGIRTTDNEKVDEQSNVIPFASFLAEVKLENSGHQFDVVGTFTLGDATNGVDILKEPLTFTIGPFSTTIPKSSFKKAASGQLKFKRVIDCMFWDVALRPLDKNKFELKAELESEKKISLVKPEEVSITIGDDGGHAKAYSKLSS